MSNEDRTSECGPGSAGDTSTGSRANSRRRGHGRQSTPPDPGEVFDLLANERDRFLLYLLSARDRPVGIPEVAERTAAWTDATTPTQVGPDQRRRTRQQLHHVTVPRLADHGFVTVTDDPPAVSLTADGRRLRPYVEFARARERREVANYLTAMR